VLRGGEVAGRVPRLQPDGRGHPHRERPEQHQRQHLEHGGADDQGGAGRGHPQPGDQADPTSGPGGEPGERPCGHGRADDAERLREPGQALRPGDLGDQQAAGGDAGTDTHPGQHLGARQHTHGAALQAVRHPGDRRPGHR
jgi:hypothetical protein